MDSKLFVHDLIAAYLKYADRQGLQHEALDESEGHVIVKFCGHLAGKAFKSEAGNTVSSGPTHRVQRAGDKRP